MIREQSLPPSKILICQCLSPGNVEKYRDKTNGITFIFSLPMFQKECTLADHVKLNIHEDYMHLVTYVINFAPH